MASYGTLVLVFAYFSSN